jgi:hypothetical protein
MNNDGPFLPCFIMVAIITGVSLIVPFYIFYECLGFSVWHSFLVSYFICTLIISILANSADLDLD